MTARPENGHRLTAHVKAGGCASKLGPGILDRILSTLPRYADPNVLVGFDHNDDAGVYRLAPDLAIVQTVDFFTPVVDDPYTFGAIAAANALSDVYAMGGRPVSALSVLACPASGDSDVIAAILRGGADKMREAGAAIVGGHSVADDEIKFGYAVTGVIHPDRIKTNGGAREGDALIFTKSLGTGVISTALKRGFARPEDVDASIASMLRLNGPACDAMLAADAHGCTDVSGFGFLGHAREMAVASQLTLGLEADALRFLPGALGYARQGAIPGGARNNREFASPCVEYTREIAADVDELLYDPQTSGGLLIALADPEVAGFQRACGTAYRVGRAIARGSKPLRII